jgi:ABC-type antimicrobial peptide transport system permease subunit
MRIRTLIARSLRFHWRSHLSVVLGAAVATAVLVGALVVGDSVRYSLRRTALARLGQTEVAMVAPDRFFRAALAKEMGDGSQAPAASLILVTGVAAREDGAARINHVQVLGVDEKFWQMGGTAPLLPDDATDTAVLNDRAARRLGVKAGDTILVRVAKPSALPLDAPLSGETDRTLAMRVTVRAVAGDAEFGRFSLAANQAAPYNVYLPLAWLRKEIGLADRANVLLVGDTPSGAPEPMSLTFANALLDAAWQPADAEMTLKALPKQNAVELRTSRVFLDPAIGHLPIVGENGNVGILTYFVNELRVGDRAAPYSMVSAIGRLPARQNAQAPHVGVPSLSGEGGMPTPPLRGHVLREGRDRPSGERAGHATLDTSASPGSVGAPPAASPLLTDVLPPGMADDEAVINEWLREDLGAKVGDTLEMTYYVAGAGSRLETRTSRFRIRTVVPMDGPADDPDLMPDFPGLAEVKSCRDWKPGIPLDLKKIRDKDQKYWEEYRGTPKAFVTLAAGQKMWANRWGDLTAVRFPGGADGARVNRLTRELQSDISPKTLGLFFQPVREQALTASGQAIDFGQLFLGLSIFLVAAALLLTGLLFAFNVEQRTEETGTLLALGFEPRRVRRMMLVEGGALAVAGGLVGAAAGLAYTRVMLWALATVWQGAVGGADLFFHVSPVTLAVGAAAGVVVALAVIWLAVRRQGRTPARELLAAGAEAELRLAVPKRARTWLSAAMAAAGIAGAVILLATMGKAKGEAGAGAFFGAGALLLVAFLSLCHAILAAVGQGRINLPLSPLGLIVRSATRRRGRSLATIALVACGAFLVIAVGANRRGMDEDARLPSSGTGGFALFGESSFPLFHSLAGAEGRKAYGLPAEVADQIQVVPLRVHEGDEASCLNLNRAQRPRLIGVRPDVLASRGAFTFAETRILSTKGGMPTPPLRGHVSPQGNSMPSERRAGHATPDNGVLPESPWMLLTAKGAADAVPAIADANTIEWSLGKKVGDEIPYTDQFGRTFRLQLVGAVAGSILQGSLIISEDALLERFPSESGYRMFLIDAPPESAAEVSSVLSERLSDQGLAILPATERLAEFNSVENTYLAIFQVLGGLALVLGSAGLGVVVLRNVLERRGELALMRAVGFRAKSVERLITAEHFGLLAAGLAVGIPAALLAVPPSMRPAGAPFPYLSLGLTLAAVALVGLVWTYLATRLALRGELLAALRNE